MGKGSGNTACRPSLEFGADANPQTTKAERKLLKQQQKLDKLQLLKDGFDDLKPQFDEDYQIINELNQRGLIDNHSDVLLIAQGYTPIEIVEFSSFKLTDSDISSLALNTDKTKPTLYDFHNYAIKSEIPGQIVETKDILFQHHSIDDQPSVEMGDLKIWHFHGQEIKRQKG